MSIIWYPRAYTDSESISSGSESTYYNHTLSFQQRNLNTITQIYERNLYPTNLQFVINGTSSVPAGLFNANATGRITPLGNFTGFRDSTEYFFALSPVPRAPDYVGFSKIQIVSFQSECPEVAASVVYITSSVINPGGPRDGEFIASLKQVNPLMHPPSMFCILHARRSSSNECIDRVLGIRHRRCSP